MESPLEISDTGDCKIIYDGQVSDEDKLADGRRTLARTWSIPNSMCILSDTKTEVSTSAGLHSPKLKLPQLSNGTAERVFPVRSVVSFDSSSSSALQTPSLDKLETPLSPFADAFKNYTPSGENLRTVSQRPRATSGRDQSLSSSRPDYLTRMHRQGNHTGLTPSSSVPTLSNPAPSQNQSPSSSRNPSPHNNSPCSEWTPGLPPTLEQTIIECGRVLDISRPTTGLQYSREDETSVSIQSFGALIVLCEIESNLTIQVASSNSKDIMGYTPDELFELESISNILATSQQRPFFSHARTVLHDDYDVATCGPEVFDLLISTSEGDKHLWCTMHTSNVYKDYVICEFEPELAHNSEAFGNSQIQDDQDQLPTIDLSDNHSLKIDTQLLNGFSRILPRISTAQTLDNLVHYTISALRELTGFQRVTMYHFDGDRNGIVVADAVDPSLSLQPYEGIQFEESIFPAEIKSQYLRNTVCLSYRSDDTTDLVYRASTHKLALDVSHCYLPTASVGPRQTEGSSVEACISIGVFVFGKLWGLISCQSFDKAFRLHPMLQKALWMMSTAISGNIERLSYTLPFQSDISDSSTDAFYKGQGVKAPSGDLLGLFGADYAAAFISGETKILGKPVDSQEVLALFEYLRAKELDTVLWSTDICSDFEDLDYTPGFRRLSGLLYIPLSADGNDFIIFFRRGAGPGQDGTDFGVTPDSEGISSPTPRRTEWSAAQFSKASILSLLYRTFTGIWQEKEATMQNNQLVRLLLANSAHEFRTPLNAIINYLEIALDGDLNQETRDNLSRSHSASKSLVYIINDLLDLTNAENGQNLIKDEAFSLSETLSEATDIFWEEARQKHVDLQVVQHSALPLVLGDQRRVRQVITNLISNALQHTASGAVTIESCILTESCEPGHIAIEVAIHDTGSGMSSETVETLFCELEQVSNKGYMQSPRRYERESSSQPGAESVLGLGLALVARIVRNMNGQLSLKSEEGKGSSFKIRLRFPVPSDDERSAVSKMINSKEIRLDSQKRDVQPRGTQRGAEQTTHENTQNAENIDWKEATKDASNHLCRCGDEAFPGGAPGQGENYLDISVALKSDESRRITLPQDQRDSSSVDEGAEAKSFNAEPDGAQVEHPEDSKSPLHVLVAEDDPINSTIVKKRLEKFGYSVRMTANGRECASAYRENPTSFDAVLMDLQVCVPIPILRIQLT